jgi:hypothetical protein
MLGWYLKSGHGCFLPYPFQLIINHSIIWCCWHCHQTNKYCWTNSMEQSPWEPNSPSPGQEITSLLQIPNVHYHVHRSLPGSCSEPDECIPHPHTKASIHNKILFCLGVTKQYQAGLVYCDRGAKQNLFAYVELWNPLSSVVGIDTTYRYNKDWSQFSHLLLWFHSGAKISTR